MIFLVTRVFTLQNTMNEDSTVHVYSDAKRWHIINSHAKSIPVVVCLTRRMVRFGPLSSLSQSNPASTEVNKMSMPDEQPSHMLFCPILKIMRLGWIKIQGISTWRKNVNVKIYVFVVCLINYNKLFSKKYGVILVTNAAIKQGGRDSFKNIMSFRLKFLLYKSYIDTETM